MSGVAVIYHLLANDASLTAVVPAAKIKAGVVPINTELPAISIRQISGVELSVIKRGTNQQATDRVQVTVNASTYVQQKQIIALIRAALPGTHGTVNSVSVLSLTYESDGPDLEYENPHIYEQSLDYLVTYAR
jgi:hypothetical protein